MWKKTRSGILTGELPLKTYFHVKEKTTEKNREKTKKKTERKKEAVDAEGNAMSMNHWGSDVVLAAAKVSCNESMRSWPAVQFQRASSLLVLKGWRRPCSHVFSTCFQQSVSQTISSLRKHDNSTQTDVGSSFSHRCDLLLYACAGYRSEVDRRTHVFETLICNLEGHLHSCHLSCRFDIITYNPASSSIVEAVLSHQRHR